ncbi:tripartite tricarboxylate transporter permease [Pyramidobacter sp. SM-530-WT-4B]|uniref:Tripartite tricarboxylate transporter permease n=1 Tax=Pyramidobacter porci TaxID=2605789 RepID=A0A6L5YBJ2_9BACT|nr:tripartite tricarboxylate transporter permease [Pyramidobacter porci]MST55684.1 tripartite tricarboxylate transporter permease [Pyramidobacter porci]
MDMLLTVLSALLDPSNLLVIFGGTVIGIIFGAVPGLSATTGIALMLPVSFSMTPVTGILFLGSVYVGGISGGLISAVLIGVPGTPASVATCFDGYPMAKNGRASRALGIGILASFIGTFVSVLISMIFCPILARYAVKMGPWEFFSLCSCAIILVVTMSKGNIFNGLIAGLLGVIISTIGIAPIDGAKRFTFDIVNLYSGVNQIGLILGVFAVATLVKNFAKGDTKTPDIDTKSVTGFGIPFGEFFSYWFLIVKSFFIGLWIGFLPGLGAGLANLVAYAQAKASSKTPEKFGTGCDEGIIASETSNNAAIGGAIIPMVALGIPGDTPTAMLIGGLMIHGIDAGPLLMVNNRELVYCFFGVLLFSAVLVLVLQFFGMRTFPYILRTPVCYLYAAILAICVVGAYADSNTIFNCGLMIVMGGVAILMAAGNLPTSPFILGYILGPMLESNLRQGLTYSQNGFVTFVTRPVSLTLLLIAFGSLVWPFVRDRRKAERHLSGTETEMEKMSKVFDVKED